jgi:UDP-N-acetylglucosamine 2-epimerase (non-hydrolysing)
LVGDKKILFPIHPRTQAILSENQTNFKNIIFVLPQGYLNFMYLIKNSFAVITDSGGISEETTVLGIPCFTMRNNTERPETETIGTNTIVGTSLENLRKSFAAFLQNRSKKAGIPELWDGKASERIISILLNKK